MRQRHAIPTTYAGVRFRSRLEARWAAFFDQLGWPWQYEPLDLAGYIPDFVLPFPDGRLLVEAKPATSFDALYPHIQKLAAGGWDGAAALVGAYPMPPYVGGEHLRAPWIFRDVGWDLDHFVPSVITVCADCEAPTQVIGWRCPRCGSDANRLGLGEQWMLPLAASAIDAHWAAAANATQWVAGGPA